MRLKPLPVILALLLSLPTLCNAADGLALSCAVNNTGNNGTPVCAAPNVTSPATVSNNVGGGNPINILTGNKFEQAVDIQAVGDGYALGLTRYYNSRSSQRGILGIGWRSDYEMQLQDTGDTIQVIQADGRKITFTKRAVNLDDSQTYINQYQSDKPELGYITQTQVSDVSKPSWIWHLPDGQTFDFIVHKKVIALNSDGQYRYGQLSRVTKQADNPTSPYWSLTYGVDGKLAKVRNHNGETLTYSYTATSHGLPQITITQGHVNSSKAQVWHYLLDKHNNLAQIISPEGVRTGYKYQDPNDKHNLTAKYRYNNKIPELITQWTYDAYDRAISSAHANDIEKIEVAYDTDTLIPMEDNHIFTNRITNSLGESTEYRYRIVAGEAQLLSVIGAGCVTCAEPNMSYEYDDAGRLIQSSKLDSTRKVIATTRHIYDKQGRIINTQNITNNENKTLNNIHYEYVSDDTDSSHFTLIAKKWTDSVANGKKTGISYRYNELGLPIQKQEFGYTPVGQRIERTYLLSYNRKGQLTQVALQDNSNPNSPPLIIEAYTWFDDGSVKTSEQPHLNIKTTFTHNERGQTTQIERQEGSEQVLIQIGHDARHQPASLTRYINGELVNGVKYKRNNLGKISSVTDLDDNFIASYAYDDIGRNLGELTSDKVVLRHLDTEGRPIVNYAMTALGADKLSYLYDDKNRIKAVGRDDTQLVAVEYDEDDSAALITGASGTQTIVDISKDTQQNKTIELPNKWDALGVKQTHIAAPTSSTTQFTQNNGLNTTYGYDDFGRIVFIDSQTTGRNTYEYNHRDELTRIVLASGVSITYDYDNKGRRIRKNVMQDGDIVQNVTWTFNAKDQLVAAIGSNQTVKYNYDEQGRVTKKQLILKGLDNPLITTFSYDDTDELASVTLPDGVELLNGDNEISYKAPDDLKARVIFEQNEHQAVGGNSISYQLGQHIAMGHYYDDTGKFAGLSYRTLLQSGNNPFIKSAHAASPASSALFSQQWARTEDGIVDEVTEIDHQGRVIERNYLYDSQYHLISSSHKPLSLDSNFKAVSTNKADDAPYVRIVVTPKNNSKGATRNHHAKIQQ